MGLNMASCGSGVYVCVCVRDTVKWQVGGGKEEVELFAVQQKRRMKPDFNKFGLFIYKKQKNKFKLITC